MKRIFGLAGIAAGAALFLFFRDLEFGWFDGGSLGIALMVLGVIELLESMRRRKPKGIVEELRDDFGLGSRNRDRYDDRDRYDRDRYRDDYDRSDRDDDRRGGHDRDRETYRNLDRRFDREAERGARRRRDYPDV